MRTGKHAHLTLPLLCCSLLAHYVLKEELHRRNIAGVALAVLGAVLLEPSTPLRPCSTANSFFWRAICATRDAPISSRQVLIVGYAPTSDRTLTMELLEEYMSQVRSLDFAPRRRANPPLFAPNRP
jgi:hypothetical protein